MFESIFSIIQNTYKLNCLPNYETYWPYEDKIKEFYLLKSNGFPVIESRIFWNNNDAHNFLKETEFPIIVKLSKGASSSNVVLVNSVSEGEKIINQVFDKGVKSKGLKSKSSLFSLSKLGLRKYIRSLLKTSLIDVGMIRNKSEYPEWQIQKDAILFQKYLPNNLFDTRVTVIGNRAIAFRRFVRKNDFRASGSGNFDTNPEKIDLDCIKIALNVSKKLNFNTMAYDFIYDENQKPYIGEISYCFVDWVVESCPGFWDENLQFHNSRNWPQHYQLEDFLRIKLK
jgi:hypothetical protein